MSALTPRQNPGLVWGLLAVLVLLILALAGCAKPNPASVAHALDRTVRLVADLHRVLCEDHPELAEPGQCEAGPPAVESTEDGLRESLELYAVVCTGDPPAANPTWCDWTLEDITAAAQNRSLGND